MNQTMKGNFAKATSITICAAAALFLCGAASAQMSRGGYSPENTPGTSNYPSQPGLGQTPTPTNTISDADFAKQAAEGNLAEIKLGQLAQDKGSSDAVKEFSKRIVEDHTQANDQLNSIASQKEIKLPTEVDRHDQKTYDKLSQLSGEAFDRAYMKEMVKGHQDAISLFQQEANGGQDASIKGFASKTLPTLQEHLKMARETSKTVAQESEGGTKSASNGK